MAERDEFVAPFRVHWVKSYAGSRREVFLEALYADPGDETDDPTEELMQNIAYENNDPQFAVARPDSEGQVHGVIITLDEEPPPSGTVVELVMRVRTGGMIGLVGDGVL